MASLTADQVHTVAGCTSLQLMDCIEALLRPACVSCQLNSVPVPVLADSRVLAAPMALKRDMAVKTEENMTSDILKIFLDLGLGHVKQQKGCGPLHL